jgi:IS5 family transposase
LLDEKTDTGKDLWADSAYTGENQDKIIDKYKMNNKVCEKGTRNNPLTEEQKANNKEKSKLGQGLNMFLALLKGA